MSKYASQTGIELKWISYASDHSSTPAIRLSFFTERDKCNDFAQRYVPAVHLGSVPPSVIWHNTPWVSDYPT